MFSGAYTAIVTPFSANGQVDYEKLRSLLEVQIDSGIDGVVPVGTTGESPTLTVEEHCRVIEVCVKVCDGRIKVVAGTGANSTAEALELTARAREMGADGTLQVTPYYNKPNQEGLYRHFCAVAELGLPVMLYNIPGRTGREIELDTVARLAQHPNIVAIKEAGGCVDRVSATLGRCDLDVLSGDDPLTLPMLAVGAVGVVSVASNIVPHKVAEMVHAALDGRWPEAQAIHRAYHRLFKALVSIDTNPVPVKTAMAMMGQIEESMRLPLYGMAEGPKAKLRELLHEVKLV